MHQYKTCSRCRQSKPMDDFYCQRKSIDGKQTYCKPCSIEVSKKWARDNKYYRQMLRDMGPHRHHERCLETEMCQEASR